MMRTVLANFVQGRFYCACASDCYSFRCWCCRPYGRRWLDLPACAALLHGFPVS